MVNMCKQQGLMQIEKKTAILFQKPRYVVPKDPEKEDPKKNQQYHPESRTILQQS